jgi:hypothetical protein
MRRITNITILKMKISVGGNDPMGKLQPPQNRITFKVDIIIMLAYSAMRDSAKPIELYSTLYPATSSASASGESNGGRLVSARVGMKKTSDSGNRGIPSQIHVLWNVTISESERDPTHISTEMIISPNETS